MDGDSQVDGVDGDSQVDGLDGDSQEEFWQNLGKKRITDHDFPPPFVKCGVGKQKISEEINQYEALKASVDKDEELIKMRFLEGLEGRGKNSNV